MTLWLDDGDVRLHHGDCLAVMRELDAESIDAVVTDPPYGIGFMGHEWDQPGVETRRNGKPGPHRRRPGVDGDHTKTRERGGSMEAGRYDLSHSANARFQAWCEAWAVECLRVLRPGGHLLSFGGTRTYHRLTSGIEDAGFEIRDCLVWLYGSGFPKSLDVSKAIDKAAGATREVVGRRADADKLSFGGKHEGWDRPWMHDEEALERSRSVTAPATAAAAQWQGWGTALKPGHEPVCVARKPIRGTVSANVLEHGTGALNIDACRIGVEDDAYARNHSGDRGHDGTRSIEDRGATDLRPGGGSASTVGRWPANVVLDDEAGAMLDEQTGERPGFSGGGTKGAGFRSEYVGGDDKGWTKDAPLYFNDSGGASRFFYCAKASALDRGHENDHPTVKPVDLMRWLVRMVTPPGGIVLDPFAGSGTTGVACRVEHFRCVLIEREEKYLPIIAGRLSQLSLLGDNA